MMRPLLVFFTATVCLGTIVAQSHETVSFGPEPNDYYLVFEPSSSNGMRHPHSWSIVDSEEFVDWVVRVFN